MKRIRMAVAMLAMAGAAGGWGVARAQNPPAPQGAPDSGRMAPMGRDGMNPEQLRMQIEERWDRRVQTELGLSDQQMDRLRTAERANQDRHRDLTRREEDLHRTVQEQLQPGVAANNGTLSDAVDQLASLRVQHAQSDQQLVHDLAFLSPVQRARYFIMARRFQDMLEGVRRRAQMGQMMGPPGMAPSPGGMPGRRPYMMPRRAPQPMDER